MVGLLTYSLFVGLPVPVSIRIVTFQEQKVWCGVYSSGNCSGFSPDSPLVIILKNHKPTANVGDWYKIPKLF
jgi:hypothetical protein